MAGFAKITSVQNYYGQRIVNVFWYRSTSWNPLAGNPFEDIRDLLNTWWSATNSAWEEVAMIAAVMQKIEGVGYTDSFAEVPGAFNTKTILSPGVLGGPADSATGTANISWRCGEQHQINGIGSSRRNRGSTAIGPIPSDRLSDDGHFLGDYVAGRLNELARVLSMTILEVPAFTSVVPIRIHQKYVPNPIPGLPKILVFRTYSDILGYGLPSVASNRKSRRPEA